MTRLVEEAVLANNAGTPVRAETHLRRAVQLLNRTPSGPEARRLRAHVEITLAVALYTRGERVRAFAALDDAEALLHRLPVTPMHSYVLAQRASLHGRSGEWDLARDLLERIDVTGPTVAPRTRTLVHLNLGLAYQFLGRYSESDGRLRRAHQLATAHRFADLGAAAIHNRGRLQMLLGNLPQSLSLMERAQDVGPGLLPPAALLDAARVLAEAGLVDRALSTLEDGTAAARRDRVAHDLAESNLERARLALIRGDPDAARRHAVRAESQFARIHEPAWVTRAALLRIDSDLMAGRRTDLVAEEAMRLAQGQAQRSAVTAETILLTVEACARSGRTADAEQALTHPAVRRLRSFPLRLRRNLTTAILHRTRGEDRLARTALRRGAVQLAAEQARYTSLDSQTAIALHTRRLRDLHVQLAIESGSASEIFAVTELWRGVSQRIPAVTSPLDPEAARLTADARRLHLEAHEEPDTTRRARLEARIRHAEEAIARHDLQRSPDDTDAPATPTIRPTTVTALRPLLAATGASVLSLFLHRGQLRAVTVTARGAVVHVIPTSEQVVDVAVRIRADLTALQHAQGTPLAGAVSRSLRRDADTLGGLLAPILPDTRRLVILPSRGVASVPWRLVPAVAGRPVTVAPSATFWAGRRSRPEGSVGPATPRIVALAGPGLRRASEEVRDVANAWHGTGRWLTGTAATGRALADALRDETVVHVAAHGTHHEENPLFSSVQMADGPQWIHEVQRVGVGADHVVLSSCEVGRTHLREGDEGLGLTAGLLACGVRSVVAAVAPVGDQEASELMSRYHQGLVRGLDAAEALDQASVGVPGAGMFCTYGSDWSRAAASGEPSALTSTRR
ncbi:MAG: CHAT domain-containing protein [Dermatophilaceae bacterium]